MKQTMTKLLLQNELSSSVNRRVREGLLIIFVSMALYMLVALITHHADDPGWSQTGVSNNVVNLAGKTGAWFSDILFFLFGYMAYILPLMIISMGLFVYRTMALDQSQRTRTKASVWYIRTTGFILALLTSCGLASMHSVSIQSAEYLENTGDLASLSMTGGGLLGIALKTMLVNQLNYVGATIILLAFFLASITLFTGLSWLKLTDLLGHYTWRLMVKIRQESPHWYQTAKEGLIALKHSQAYRKIKQYAINGYIFVYQKVSNKIGRKSVDTFHARVQYPHHDAFEEVHSFKKAMRPIDRSSRSEGIIAASLDRRIENTRNKLEDIREDIREEIRDSRVNNSIQNPIQTQTRRPVTEFASVKPAASFGAGMKLAAKQMIGALSTSMTAGGTNTNTDSHNDAVNNFVTHNPPSLGLLDASESRPALRVNKAELDNLAVLVERRLTEFGVQAKVMAIHPGPVVTRFELDLAAGIKVSKISGLAKDIARSLSVMSVRVVEVIPGKSYIGIEIPNQQRELVRLKEILISGEYQSAHSPLTLGLGKDISGRPVSVDLAKMPHLLVAGTTGSGKSVGINAMILSILYKATPEVVRMILIDPKMLELSVYDKIPHLLTPVVTDMKNSPSALRLCVAEMESRYQIMVAGGVRKLAGYNLKKEETQRNQRPVI